MGSGLGDEEAEYTHENGTVRTQFNQENTPASMAVIRTLAELMDTDPVELEPLYSTLDPDALDKIFNVRDTLADAFDVSFIHEGHTITVFSSGEISISHGEATPAVDCDTAV